MFRYSENRLLYFRFLSAPNDRIFFSIQKPINEWRLVSILWWNFSPQVFSSHLFFLRAYFARATKMPFYKFDACERAKIKAKKTNAKILRFHTQKKKKEIMRRKWKKEINYKKKRKKILNFKMFLHTSFSTLFFWQWYIALFRAKSPLVCWHFCLAFIKGSCI